MLTEDLIRLSAPDFGPEPETKYAWRWKAWYAYPAAVFIALGIAGWGWLS